MSKLCATWKRRCNQIWNELYLWRDIDANGMSTVSQMLRPGALGMASFETIAKFRRCSLIAFSGEMAVVAAGPREAVSEP